MTPPTASVVIAAFASDRWEYLRDAARGDGAGVARGAAIVVGLGVAAAGFAVGASALLTRTMPARRAHPRTAMEVSR